MGEAGVYDAMRGNGDAALIPGACGYCSSPFQEVIHGGPCPRVEAIDYYPNGAVKRVQLRPASTQGEEAR